MADITLDGFKAGIADYARPNRFYVTIQGNQGGASWNETLSFLVKECQLPGRTIGEIEVKWQGMTSKISGDPTFEDLTMTMNNSYDWDGRKYLEQWMEGNVLIGEDGTNTRTAPAEYKAEIQIEQLGRDGETLATYMCKGCILKSIDSLQLSQDSNDTIEELSLTFSIDMWYVV